MALTWASLPLALALLLASGAGAAQSETMATPGADETCSGGECVNEEFSMMQHSRASPAGQSDFKGEHRADELKAVVTFGDGVNGSMKFRQSWVGVRFSTKGFSVSSELLREICGELTVEDENATFSYHIHEKFPDGKSFDTGAGCGSAETGGHWDPTAACGPSSGNPTCGTCKKEPYTCSPEKFDAEKSDQYTGCPNACELGDLSGMFGLIEASCKPKETGIKTAGKTGVAQMDAKKGSVDDDTCKPQGDGFQHAGHGLREIRGRSVVVHCGSQFEKSGARLFCGKIE